MCIPIDPMIRVLRWSAALIGAIVAIMAVMLLLATRPAVTGRLQIPRRLGVPGWLCTGPTAAAVLVMFATI
ncbi:hypothetical protein LPN04_02450 [Rugamonas sp. A1-17]|nr:hypothetical protein [Rugamonas sp. A1-17]